MTKKHGRPLFYTVFSTAWGHFGLAGTRGSLIRTHLPFTDRNQVVQNLLAGLGPASPKTASRGGLAEFDAGYFSQLQERIKAYYKGTCADSFFDIRVNLHGMSLFTSSVLRACRKIRPGQTATYAQLARKVGRPKAVRAVGGALARNPLPLIIPCHRVIRSDPDKSGLGGYSGPGGTRLKRKMLEFESRFIGMTENQIA
jgi:methylated-DNA-[protein]-cysteine S-methyltransferase